MDVALNNAPADLDALKAMDYGDGLNIADKITEQIGKIGEKIELSTYEKVNADSVIAYNHPGNRLASIVGFTKEATGDIGRDVAMQVAAMAPVAVNADGVSPDVIAKELEIGKDLAIQEGKPAEMAEKIAKGRLGKFLKEATLLSQPFIKDNKMTIDQYLRASDKDLTVTEFRRVALN
jgi:elongation factor Ts